MPPEHQYENGVPLKAFSSLKIVPTPHRSSLQTGELWLKDKRHTDGAEDLWRIHDALYDLSSFIRIHPGGSKWLELTQGTDITEAFESHHISAFPQELLSRYYVRDARTPRNSPFTFKADGFYRTLKREVAKVVAQLPKDTPKRSAFVADSLLAATVFCAINANFFQSVLLAMLAGNLLACLTIASHNYFHQRDNFRMYYFDLSMLSHREWRISHALSHHLHTNTINDMEISSQEPVIEFLPKHKSLFQRLIALIAMPIFWMLLLHLSFCRLILSCVKGECRFRAHQLTPLVLPTVMHICRHAEQTLTGTIWLWTVTILMASTHFGLVGFTAAHHHPDIFHDGDTPRSNTDYDWGLSQLDALMDRRELSGSHFMVLTMFGDHALHHLFPTLDHATLEALYPVFSKVCQEFSVDLRWTTQFQLVKGTFQQLTRMKINPNPPDLLKKY